MYVYMYIMYTYEYLVNINADSRIIYKPQEDRAFFNQEQIDIYRLPFNASEPPPPPTLFPSNSVSCSLELL